MITSWCMACAAFSSQKVTVGIESYFFKFKPTLFSLQSNHCLPYPLLPWTFPIVTLINPVWLLSWGLSDWTMSCLREGFGHRASRHAFNAQGLLHNRCSRNTACNSMYSSFLRSKKTYPVTALERGLFTPPGAPLWGGAGGELQFDFFLWQFCCFL